MQPRGYGTRGAGVSEMGDLLWPLNRDACNDCTPVCCRQSHAGILPSISRRFVIVRRKACPLESLSRQLDARRVTVPGADEAKAVLNIRHDVWLRQDVSVENSVGRIPVGIAHNEM